MEILTSILGSIGRSITDHLSDAIGRQLGYLLHYNDNIEALKKQYQKIGGTRATIQGRVDAAKRNREIILPDVQKWISEVDSISMETEKLLEDEANKRCFKGWCINIRSSYRFNKEAKQKTAKIYQLQEDGKFQNVSRPAPPPRIISSSAGFSGTFESRESIKKEIMEALNDDGVSIIGIYGMGGMGKTTLVKEIGKQVIEVKIYDTVVMTVVSQTPNISKIQGNIANMLGLTLSLDNSEAVKARSLWKRIKDEKRILIILDDIWRRIKLDKIGIPIGKDHRGCKVVFTSRSKNVCDQMVCQKIFGIGTLSNQESWVLFKELAGPDIEDSFDISPIARDIVARCDGSPIAIVTIARALKNKGKHVWSDAAQQLQKSSPSNIEGVQGNVILSLELSYNYIEGEETKSLFLFCSLFPEDFKIPIEDLVRYGVGLRLFKNVDTIDDVRDRVHAVVSTLTSSFLLIDDSNYDRKYVKMHDVVRDFALVIASKYNNMFMVKCGVPLQKSPSRDFCEDLTAISLMSDHIEVVPEGLEFPKLQTLLLQENSELVLPTTFFQGMKDLKVLDLSETKLSSLPDSFSTLTNLRTLYLNDCNMEDLSMIGQLCKLEILSLRYCNIEEVPTSLSQLSHLRLLDLSGCKKLKLIPHRLIPCLRELEELYLLRSFKHWDFERLGDSRSNARLADLQALSRLTTLHICIPNPDLLFYDILFQSLTNFIFEIGHESPKEWCTSGYSRSMSFMEIRALEVFDCFKNLIKRTQNLFLGQISGLENILDDLFKQKLNELKALTIQSCHMRINENLELVEICHGRPPVECFSKLKSSYLNGCYSMLNIVPSQLLLRLHNLETFSAYRCKSVRYVFDFEGLGIVNGETEILSSLKNLHLERMTKMTHIWKGENQLVSLCNLKQIYLFGCPELIEVFSPALLQSLISLEEIDIRGCDNLPEVFGTKEEEGIVEWKKNDIITSPSLGNLTYVTIIHCNSMRNLFTPSIAKSLVKLRTLGVWKCDRMREIVTNKERGKGASIKRIVFPNLYEMELGYLVSLSCFGSGLYTIEFPALEKLGIEGCPRLETFGYRELVTPKLNKVRVEGRDRWNGDLNTTVQVQIFNEQAFDKVRIHDEDDWNGDLNRTVQQYFNEQEMKESEDEELEETENEDAQIISRLALYIPESRQSIMKQIMEALNDDNVHIIGVCGMGGVGKTLLVKEIAKVVKEAKLYDSVLMAGFSHTPSTFKIQQRIANMLGLKLLSDSESMRAVLLWERIRREKRLLLILDDIWRKIELDMIGIPFGKEHGGCKVILTSRIRDVCNQMGCQKIFIVESLSKQESWALFKKFVGSDAEKTNLSPIARDVAANCGGLPIAIVTIARALKNKRMDIWIDAAQQLQKSITSNIEGMYGNVISSLKLSYDFLESEEAKSFFLFCSLFPKDFKIPVEVLMRYGMGLRWFNNVETMEDVRHRAHGVVSALVSSFLLIHHKENDDDKGYVKMNSMVRDFAHVIASRYNKFMVKAGIYLPEWPGIDTFEDLTCISLMSNNIKEVPDGLECPKLQCLLLQRNSGLVVPNNFFQGMKDLKVLDLSENQLLHLPQSLSLLANLRTLYLDNCELGDLSIIGHLRKLEILSLCDSKIMEIPISFSDLSRLRLLDLTRCKGLTIISPGVIKCLGNLEELSMVKSFSYWDSESNAKLVELKHLPRLSCLKICIPNLDILANNVISFKNLTSFTIIIGDPEESLLDLFLSETRRYSRNVMLFDHDVRISKFPDVIECLLKRTETLFMTGLKRKKIYGRPEMKSFDYGDKHMWEVEKMELEEQGGNIYLDATLQQIFNEKDLESIMLPKMKHVWKGDNQFVNLHNLKRINLVHFLKLVKCFSPTLLQSLTSLEQMEISYCSNLEQIFGTKEEDGLGKSILLKRNNNITSPNLGNLTYIAISYCHKLKNLFTLSIVKSLAGLRILKLSHCSTILEIVTNEKEEKGALTEKIVLPSLCYMELEDLDSLTSFYSGLNPIEFVALEKLMIRQCPKMKTFAYGVLLTPKLNKVSTKNVGVRISPNFKSIG